METMFQDIRYAFRMLCKAPGFTVVVVLTLALGIGANTAIFSIVNAVALRLPFADPNRMVVVENSYPDSDPTPASYPDFTDWRQQSRSFRQLAASFRSSFNLAAVGEPQRIQGTYVSQDYFDLFGIRAQLGRTFLPAEHQKGAAGVCVISQGFWRRDFASDPGVLGRALALDGAVCTVVGVMPADAPDFHAPPYSEVWIPLEAKPPYDMHGTNYLQVIGRLKAGVTRENALREVQSLQQQINAHYPPNSHGVVVQPLSDVLLGDTQPVLQVLLAAVGLVLLIACANVANLLLARGTGRMKEFAVREALGARPWRLVRQSLTESALLALGALLAATVLTRWAMQAFLRFWPETLRKPEVVLDWRVAAFAGLVSLIAVFLFGLAPALLSARSNLNLAMKEGSRQTTGSASHGRLRTIFVVSEMALALVLVIASLLTLRSFNRLLHTDPGFNPEKLLTARIALPDSRYSDDAGQRFFQELLTRIGNLPGVQSAAASAYVPLGDGGQTGDFQVEGRAMEPGKGPFTEEHFVTPGYFQTMQIPLLRGRSFAETDRKGSPKVVIVNDYLARQLWPGQDPIGRHIGVLGAPNDWSEIIGVVADVKAAGLNTPPAMQVYLSTLQHPITDMFVVVRATTDPGSLVPAVKRAVFELDSQQPVANIALMNELRFRSLSGSRSSTFLLGIFAALAMLLAGVGIYAVMAYNVGQRVHEIGIRMALGAGGWDIHRMVLEAALRMAVWGIGIGLVAAFAVTRFLHALLFGITATDAASYTLSAVALSGIVLLASYIPARRATRIHPMTALRYE
ncbi:MAG TPA: ABC transporter permease [Terriglobales bacterium]|jgi:putative ABC transport system permease protein|nr:ABC transporter permease [Terriglobales bacterium]